MAHMWHGTHIYNYTPACPACLPVGIISHLYHTPLIYNITVNTSCSELQAGSEQEARNDCYYGNRVLVINYT